MLASVFAGRTFVINAPATEIVAGENIQKITTANKDANQVTTQGVYIANCYVEDATNYPALRDMCLLEVYVAFISGHTYIFQRINSFHGECFVRSKTNEAEWNTWVKVGA